MADLSVEQSAVLAHLVERCPDGALTQLSVAVRTMKGAKAAALSAMLMREAEDRRRRARVLAPLLPLFRPRADGVDGLTYPASVLPRLWKAASAQEPGLLRLVDDDDADAVAAADRICLAAAAAVRDRPDVVWPGAGPEREAGLASLARACDLAHLVRRSLPLLPAWTGRADGDQLSELRLLIHDTAAVAPDGSRQLMEMLFAHMSDAAGLMRVVVNTSHNAGREAFLADSEMASFVDRLLRAVEARVARITACRAVSVDAVQPLRADIDWAASVLAEMDVCLAPNPRSVWGKQIREARGRINTTLTRQMRGVGKALDAVLPTARVPCAGRMTREAPDTQSAPEASTAADAAAHLTLLGALRGAAPVFGCEGDRHKLAAGATDRLETYADQLFDVINGGEAVNEAAALTRAAMIADYLTLLGAEGQARTVRRRAAASRGSPLAA